LIRTTTFDSIEDHQKTTLFSINSGCVLTGDRARRQNAPATIVFRGGFRHCQLSIAIGELGVPRHHTAAAENSACPSTAKSVVSFRV